MHCGRALFQCMETVSSLFRRFDHVHPAAHCSGRHHLLILQPDTHAQPTYCALVEAFGRVSVTKVLSCGFRFSITQCSSIVPESSCPQMSYTCTPSVTPSADSGTVIVTGLSERLTTNTACTPPGSVFAQHYHTSLPRAVSRPVPIGPCKTSRPGWPAHAWFTAMACVFERIGQIASTAVLLVMRRPHTLCSTTMKLRRK